MYTGITNNSWPTSKYYLQYEQPCCIRHTVQSRKREIVYPIQHGHEYCKVHVLGCKRLDVVDVNVCIRRNPRDRNDFW